MLSHGVSLHSSTLLQDCRSPLACIRQLRLVVLQGWRDGLKGCGSFFSSRVQLERGGCVTDFCPPIQPLGSWVSEHHQVLAVFLLVCMRYTEICVLKSMQISVLFPQLSVFQMLS